MSFLCFIVYIYIYIYICVCVCVCFSNLWRLNKVNILLYYLRLLNYINLFSDSKIKHKRGLWPFDYIWEGFWLKWFSLEGDFTWIWLVHIVGSGLFPPGLLGGQTFWPMDVLANYFFKVGIVLANVWTNKLTGCWTSLFIDIS